MFADLDDMPFNPVNVAALLDRAKQEVQPDRVKEVDRVVPHQILITELLSAKNRPITAISVNTKLASYPDWRECH